MDTEEAQPLENDEEILKVAKSVYAILHAWATSGTQLVYSAGTYGFRVEGTIRALREPEDDSWGIFEASFRFKSKSREITAHVLLMPGMKILTKPSDEVCAIEFGAKGDCSLRPVGRRGPNPDDVMKVIAQLNAWVERKMRVWVYLDFGFSALASSCLIEAVNEQQFALTEESSDRTVFAIPALGSDVSIDDLEGAKIVTITSEDRSSKLSIFEPGTTRDDLMSRMLTNMIQ